MDTNRSKKPFFKIEKNTKKKKSKKPFFFEKKKFKKNVVIEKLVYSYVDGTVRKKEILKIVF